MQVFGPLSLLMLFALWARDFLSRLGFYNGRSDHRGGRWLGRGFLGLVIGYLPVSFSLSRGASSRLRCSLRGRVRRPSAGAPLQFAPSKLTALVAMIDCAAMVSLCSNGDLQRETG
jgi:hypothetical protein